MKNHILIGASLLGAFILGTIAISNGTASLQQSTPQKSASESTAPDNKAQDSHDHQHDEQAEKTPLEVIFSEAEAEDIRQIVRNYLLDNPEVIIEAITIFQQEEEQRQAERKRAGAADNLNILLANKTGFVTGADRENAKVAVVELFDYHCGFCKQASGLVRELAINDPEVMVAFRELPILRQESEYAAEAALAARNQEKYIDLHFAMMNANGVLTKERIHAIAKKNKIDVKQLEADIKKPEIGNSIRETIRIAQEMGVSGTPAFIIASLDGSYIDVIGGFEQEQVFASVNAAKKASRQ